jgi:hypothetical protein
LSEGSVDGRLDGCREDDGVALGPNDGEFDGLALGLVDGYRVGDALFDASILSLSKSANPCSFSQLSRSGSTMIWLSSVTAVADAAAIDQLPRSRK